MSRHPVFSTLWYGINTLAALCLLALIYGIGWEFHTVSYLRGFSDAVVPASSSPEQKVESILDWMARGPARRSTADAASFSLRDPENTLNYRELLEVCGTATNAFVNLASSSGLKARRLLLLSPNRSAKHVVSEVWLGDRWVIVDSSYRTLFRDAQGEFVTKEQLRDREIFQEVTGALPNYPPSYTYESTAIVRLAAIPGFGPALRGILDRTFPGWEQQFGWTLLLERESLALTVAATLLLFGLVVVRFLLGRYGTRRLGIARTPLREQVRRLGGAVPTR